MRIPERELVAAIIVAVVVTLLVFLIANRFIVGSNNKIIERSAKSVEDVYERLESLLLQQSTTLRLLTTTFTHDLELYGELSDGSLAYYSEIMGQGYRYYKRFEIVMLEEATTEIPIGETHLFRGPLEEGGELFIVGIHPIYVPQSNAVWGYLKLYLSLEHILEEIRIKNFLSDYRYSLSSGGELFYGEASLSETQTFTIGTLGLVWSLNLKIPPPMGLFVTLLLRVFLPLLLGLIVFLVGRNFFIYRQRAHSDDMTGILNKSNFMRLLSVELQQCYRSGERIALAIIDIDDFKAINEQWGHIDGDKVLMTLVKAIQEAVGKDDTIARFGGDEFAVIFRDSGGEEDYYGVATEFFAAIESIDVPLSRTTLTIKSSMGMAVSGIDGLEADVLLTSADNALYEAKTSGKNRLVFS